MEDDFLLVQLIRGCVLSWQARPCASNELIQFDPPEISLPFSNKPLVFSFNIANITDFCASFWTWLPARNVGVYEVRPASARMEPRSTQRIVVKMTPKKKELEDGQYEDALTIYSGLARDGVEASDFVNRIYYEVGKEFQIVYTKQVISLQGSDCALVNFFIC
jgi:hypothetical protein